MRCGYVVRSQKSNLFHFLVIRCQRFSIVHWTIAWNCGNMNKIEWASSATDHMNNDGVLFFEELIRHTMGEWTCGDQEIYSIYSAAQRADDNNN